MSVDGAWTITIKSPMGDMTGALALKAEGGALTGTQTAQGATVPIVDGAINGDVLTWSASVTSPMPMKLAFTGTVSGDSISGTVKAGAFGAFPFAGGRA
jgi:hypothetical protein